jgi:hypothetical protein
MVQTQSLSVLPLEDSPQCLIENTLNVRLIQTIFDAFVAI